MLIVGQEIFAAVVLGVGLIRFITNVTENFFEEAAATNDSLHDS